MIPEIYNKIILNTDIFEFIFSQFVEVFFLNLIPEKKNIEGKSNEIWQRNSKKFINLSLNIMKKHDRNFKNKINMHIYSIQVLNLFASQVLDKLKLSLNIFDANREVLEACYKLPEESKNSLNVACQNFITSLDKLIDKFEFQNKIPKKELIENKDDFFILYITENIKMLWRD